MKVKARELTLGAIVRLQEHQEYMDATVKNIEDDDGEYLKVTFFRPYVTIGDFSHTGGISCYIGIEEFRACPKMDFEYELLREGPELK